MLLEILPNQILNETDFMLHKHQTNDILLKFFNTGFKTESEKMLCGTIVLAHKMGGNSARIFERIGDCFHHTYELSSDTKSALAQVKLSAMVISALPVGFLAISSLIGLGGTSFLFTEPIGIVCLVGGLTLQAIGIYWMRRMVQKGVGIWTS